MNTFFSVLMVSFFALPLFGQTDFAFSKEEVLSDLITLRSSLKEAHYDVYAYTTDEALDSAWRAVEKDISKDSLTLLETIGLFQRYISAVNNGHTEIDFPGNAYANYAYAGGTVFPLEIAFEQEKALVRKNWSDENQIRIGSEVISINGLSLEEILLEIYPYLSAERPYFKNAKIELYSFPRLYWQAFGEQAVFNVEILSGGNIQKFTLPSVSVIEGYEMKRNEVINASMQLKFFNEIAYLNPGNFSGDQSSFERFIDSAFIEIRERKCEQLILDFRNNLGGDNAFSDYLVSYFADEPFRWSSSFSLKASGFLKDHVRRYYDTTAVFWRDVLSRDDGEQYEYVFDPHPPQPKQKRFDGRVYVLINRQSHSQSAVAAAQIQDYGFGTIVGEETGDYPSLYASQFQYALPETGILVKVSKGYIVRVNGNKEEKGVIPDILIRDHLLDEEDEILEGLLERLER